MKEIHTKYFNHERKNFQKSRKFFPKNSQDKQPPQRTIIFKKEEHRWDSISFRARFSNISEKGWEIFGNYFNEFYTKIKERKELEEAGKKINQWRLSIDATEFSGIRKMKIKEFSISARTKKNLPPFYRLYQFFSDLDVIFKAFWEWFVYENKFFEDYDARLRLEFKQNRFLIHLEISEILFDDNKAIFKNFGEIEIPYAEQRIASLKELVFWLNTKRRKKSCYFDGGEVSEGSDGNMNGKGSENGQKKIIIIHKNRNENGKEKKNGSCGGTLYFGRRNDIGLAFYLYFDDEEDKERALKEISEYFKENERGVLRDIQGKIKEFSSDFNIVPATKEGFSYTDGRNFIEVRYRFLKIGEKEIQGDFANFILALKSLTENKENEWLIRKFVEFIAEKEGYSEKNGFIEFLFEILRNLDFSAIEIQEKKNGRGKKGYKYFRCRSEELLFILLVLYSYCEREKVRNFFRLRSFLINRFISGKISKKKKEEKRERRSKEKDRQVKARTPEKSKDACIIFPYARSPPFMEFSRIFIRSPPACPSAPSLLPVLEFFAPFSLPFLPSSYLS